EVRGREAEPAPPSLPSHDEAVQRVGPAEASPRLVEALLLHGAADAGGRDRRAVRLDRRHDVHPEAELSSHLADRVRVARTPAAEPVVVADHQLFHTEAREEDLLHEAAGLVPR